MPNYSDKTEVKQPKLQTYCALLYERFDAEAVTEVHDEVELRVWRGKLTATALDVGIPDGVYKRVMDQLHQLKCIEQVERGYRGQSPTVVLLYRPPTAEVWEDEGEGRDLTRGVTPAILDRRTTDLERRLEGIDVKRALAELQQQIDDINRSLHTVTSNEQ